MIESDYPADEPAERVFAPAATDASGAAPAAGRRLSSVGIPPEVHDDVVRLKSRYGMPLNKIVAWAIRAGLPTVEAELKKLKMGDRP